MIFYQRVQKIFMSKGWGYQFSSVQSCCHIQMFYRHTVFSKCIHCASHRQRWSRTNKHKYLDKRCIWGSMNVPCFWNILWLIYLVFTWNKHVANVKKTFSCAHTIQTVPKHANQIKLHLSLGFTKNLRRTILWEWLMALNH